MNGGQLWLAMVSVIVLALILNPFNDRGSEVYQPSLSAPYEARPPVEPTREPLMAHGPANGMSQIRFSIATLWPTAPAIPPKPKSTTSAWQLSETEMMAVLTAAGWPDELHAQALSVACGIGNAYWKHGESNCHPESTNGRYRCLFQLQWPFWFSFAGEDPDQWADPVVCARAAYAVYRYDLARGNEPWHQWEVKP